MRRVHLLGHMRHELAEVEKLLVNIDDMRPVSLGDDGTFPTFAGNLGSKSRRLHVVFTGC